MLSKQASGSLHTALECIVVRIIFSRITQSLMNILQVRLLQICELLQNVADIHWLQDFLAQDVLNVAISDAFFVTGSVSPLMARLAEPR